MEQKYQMSAALTLSSAERMLVGFYKKNPSLWALYLLSRDSRNEKIFQLEDLCEFTIRFLSGGRTTISTPAVIGEEIYDFIFGRPPNKVNVFSAFVKAAYYDGRFSKSVIDFDEFYYLYYLPSRRLYHLTDRYEKANIARLCKNYASRKNDLLQASLQRQGGTESLSPITETLPLKVLQKISKMAGARHDQTAPSIAITIFGLHRSLMGLGEDARRMFDMLTELGYRVELFDCSPPGLERDDLTDYYELFETTSPSARVALFCMPVFEMARLILKFPVEFFRSRYVVGHLPWELTEFPPGWREILDLVDEIWAPSRFLSCVYRRACSKPVYHVPLCVELENEIDDQFAREYIKPNCENFISIFDFNSLIQRKNPIGSIASFRRAFDNSDIDAHLLLKSIHGRGNQASLGEVLAEIGSDPRITLVDGPISKGELYSLIRHSTAFLSLHRSEGFGRLLVESMLLGTPVIATDWSGSRDFIKPGLGFPVRCRLRPVEACEYPYAAGEWAEPDLEDAAAAMRLVAANRDVRLAAARSGADFASSTFSREAVKIIVGERLREICSALTVSHPEQP